MNLEIKKAENDSFLIVNDKVEVPYTEPTEFEKSLLKGTLTASELLESEKNEEVDETDLKTDVFTKVKTIALVRLGHPPISNPSRFDDKDKNNVKNLMEEILKDRTEPDFYEKITNEFNDICLSKIFNKLDYTKYQF